MAGASAPDRLPRDDCTPPAPGASLIAACAVVLLAVLTGRILPAQRPGTADRVRLRRPRRKPRLPPRGGRKQRRSNICRGNSADDTEESATIHRQRDRDDRKRNRRRPPAQRTPAAAEAAALAAAVTDYYALMPGNTDAGWAQVDAELPVRNRAEPGLLQLVLGWRAKCRGLRCRRHTARHGRGHHHLHLHGRHAIGRAHPVPIGPGRRRARRSTTRRCCPRSRIKATIDQAPGTTASLDRVRCRSARPPSRGRRPSRPVPGTTSPASTSASPATSAANSSSATLSTTVTASEPDVSRNTNCSLALCSTSRSARTSHGSRRRRPISCWCSR